MMRSESVVRAVREQREMCYRLRRVTTREDTAVELSQAWAACTVYFDGKGQANAVGALVRLYGIVDGVRALLASFSVLSATTAYAWPLPTFGCQKFEVTLQALAVTADDVSVGIVGYGYDPGGTAAEFAGINGTGVISGTDVVWTPGGDLTFPVTSSLRKLATTDATPTVIASYAIGAARTVRFVSTVVGHRSNGDGYGADFAVTYKRSGAAAAALVGILLKSGEGEDDVAFDATIDVVANVARVVVTGVGAMTWSAELRSQEIQA